MTEFGGATVKTRMTDWLGGSSCSLILSFLTLPQGIVTFSFRLCARRSLCGTRFWDGEITVGIRNYDSLG